MTVPLIGEITLGREPECTITIDDDVFISQLHLPGWSARIDDRPVPIEPVTGLLAGVRVPPGQSIRLECAYFPPGLTTGALISALSAAVLIGATIWSRRARERAPSRT